MRPFKYKDLKVGDRVRIVSGGFMGIEATVKSLGDGPHDWEVDCKTMTPSPASLGPAWGCAFGGESELLMIISSGDAVAVPTKSKDFPHKCPTCGSSVYIGFSSVEHPPGVQCR